MTDLLSDVQYFNQAGPKSYAFLFHAKTGNTMSHPKLPTPEAISEDPNSVNILELEQGKEFKKLIEEVQSTGQLRLVLKLLMRELWVQAPGLTIARAKPLYYDHPRNRLYWPLWRRKLI